MPDEIAIRVENVSKDFILPHEKVNSIKSLFTSVAKGRNKGKETQHALKDISFEVKKGEFFGIVGRNGSGKSTLLKILAGIYQPTKGQVGTVGKLVPFIELGVGFNPELTGRENVYLNGAMLGFSQKEVEVMYKDIVAFAELERFMDQKLKNYSSGMQVRLAFSMATRAKADILLIDEVLAVGDADFQRKCFEYFKKLKKDKITVVFVSHDMAAVREYCDRAMLIENSQALDIGSTEKIASQYLKLFMGDEVAAVEEDDTEQDRWGDKAMYVSNISASVEKDFVTITQSIKAMIDMEHPIAGFRIRDGAGKEVTGTNTKKERQPLPNFMAGETAIIVWTVPNIFSDGQYFIDPSLLYENEITVSDWWNDAASFTVKKGRHLPYSIDPGFKVAIEPGKKQKSGL
jgi:ABC-2 type transport system ATP-binding protein